MKIKSILLISCFLSLSFTVLAQQYAVGKKASIVFGSVSAMNQGGDFFEDTQGNNIKTLNFTSSINHFITKNFFLGGSLEFSSESQGYYTSKGVGVGPQIGCAFGDSQSEAFPFFDVGLQYYKMNIDKGYPRQFTGSDLTFGFGLIIQIQSHIGLILQGGYQMLSLKDKDLNKKYSGDVVSLGIGIAGLIFKDAK
jgi:hypothetical protein